MGRGYGEPDVEFFCGIAGCGGVTMVPAREKQENLTCEKCGCPTWPYWLGFTGNGREEVLEFMKTNDLDIYGNLRKRCWP